MYLLYKINHLLHIDTRSAFEHLETDDLINTSHINLENFDRSAPARQLGYLYKSGAVVSYCLWTTSITSINADKGGPSVPLASST